MSRHHRRQKWSTDSPKFRAAITAQLPLPCVNCGRPVMPGQSWHVGHRPGRDARSMPPGHRATLADVGPSHARCNLQDGGRAGAAITNQARDRARAATKDIRPWF